MQSVGSAVQGKKRILRQCQSALRLIPAGRSVILIARRGDRNDHIVGVISAKQENADQRFIVATGLRRVGSHGAHAPERAHHAQRSQ